ncbi:caspase family protein [Streptomyces phyllanthi]|uniref:Caspase family protein n=1 Tax=Streptomyces phyllanthi TaxID=1803180 RepID=A0A5N8VYZ2_9ACTN|nr:caspase family protein [Streptomyces phyllanthi]MPY40042.1 hypothetical protein [Streptomyces phyllanthi]
MAGATRALLVGSDSSPQSGLPLPPGAERNVSALHEALTDPLVGGLSPDLCRTVQPAAEESLLGHLTEASTGEGGLIVYWTGHATLSSEGTLYLALSGSRPGDLTTWVPARRVAEAMTAGRTATADRLLILDACFSASTGIVSGQYDTLIRRAVERVSRSGVAVLSSMGATPTGFAANSHGLSVFTRQLIAQLQIGSGTPSDELRLETLSRRVGLELDRSGYRRPCLRNSAAFLRPLVPAATAALREGSGLLPARTTSTQLTTDVRRFALAVAGAVHTGAAAAPVQPSRDANRVYQALLKSRCGFTARSSTLLDTPPTRKTLRRCLEDMAEHSRNMLLVYVSSCGTVDAGADGLDLRLGLAGQETISISDLVRDLRRTRAERVTLLIDACQAFTGHQAQPDEYADDPSRPPWGKRPGFTQLAITWNTSGTSSRLLARDPLALSAREQWSTSAWSAFTALVERGLQQPAGHVPWKFYFPGLEISCLDDQGPVSPWLAHPAAMLTSPDSDVARWLLSDHLYTSLVGPVAAAPAEEVPRPSEPDDSVHGEASPPKPRRRRGHRARLRVVEDDAAATVEAGVRVTFRYQPLDEGESGKSTAPEATDDAPLDITLRIEASAAIVRPSLIHTHLTDERGSPPSDFRVIPQSHDPVALRIDVLRRADGALIQQLRTVLPVAEAEGSKL